jgi:hypothetical protein
MMSESIYNNTISSRITTSDLLHKDATHVPVTVVKLRKQRMEYLSSLPFLNQWAIDIIRIVIDL